MHSPYTEALQQKKLTELKGGMKTPTAITARLNTGQINKCAEKTAKRYVLVIFLITVKYLPSCHLGTNEAGHSARL